MSSTDLAPSRVRLLPVLLAAVLVVVGGGAAYLAVPESDAPPTRAEAVTPIAPVVSPPPVDCAVTACVALTFDDGPGPATPQILDTLEARRVPATFFVIGRNIAGHEAVVQREARSGMEVEDHTWDHVDLTGVSRATAEQQITRTSDEIYRVTGTRPVYMRPPMGRFVEGVTATAGLTRVLWNVDSQDWMNRDSAQTTRRVLESAKPGSVILLHDLYPSTARALPAILDGLAAKGLTPVRIDQMKLQLPPPT